MSQHSKRELVQRLQPRYLKADRKEKTKILDEFVAVTGLHRKAAIRRLRQQNQPKRERRGRQKIYTGSVVSALTQIWRICGGICGKRLQPILADMVTSLERHQELALDQETKRLVLAVSPATIDRLLQPFKTSQQRGQSTTKPGGLLKHQIPVRTFADWDDTQAGFVEIDLVAHCGESTAGQFLCSFTATDVATGWTECFSLRHRSQIAVTEALDQLRQRLPFPLLGIDSDNDSVFINDLILNDCQMHKITFTRCRPYKKNDQCFVEQKNWSIVRHTIGYQRFESQAAHQLLGDIYAELHLYTNLFQPTFKLVSKKRTGAKVYKKYETPKTPLQRVLDMKLLSPENSDLWQATYRDTNPAQCRRNIDEKVKQLVRLGK
ncbi:MAG: DDE-type integrase/transposase/recombinase [Ardenticatenaceae bacterium]|nr:DDE-type integrase/transposase/recombinase [Ardenticatenaceae bacterium]MCB9418680.1 DDE-type integrase/transposase/recombinase [Ardenticatenaceae bacterium]MCB9418870.1 DDE-type integrase/transposase/recombinase [Ardenticatenaceae bacterium]MCB9419196.1 DDE-type integrase/transposase/recombinase [Ardenticatenaceae bacterium]MCB9419479.1 DDE-type integrase/transposase/recombinase [Ardenticatenaceae bacterium]